MEQAVSGSIVPVPRFKKKYANYGRIMSEDTTVRKGHLIERFFIQRGSTPWFCRTP